MWTCVPGLLVVSRIGQLARGLAALVVETTVTVWPEVVSKSKPKNPPLQPALATTGGPVTVAGFVVITNCVIVARYP